MKRILVAEGATRVREQIGQVLQQDGFSVSMVETGSQAFKKIRTEAFHVVILDAYLTGISGFQLASEIKNSEALQHILVLLLSTGGDSVSAQCDVQLTKPINAKRLLETIKALTYTESSH